MARWLHPGPILQTISTARWRNRFARPLQVVLFLSLLIGGASVPARADGLDELKKDLQDRFAGREPNRWAEIVPGVKTRLDTSEKVIALTLDACGSEGDGYDAELIDFLRRENVPATLFINRRWIRKNPERFDELAVEPLFEIENHGLRHRPASVNGRSVYGIPGTDGVEELVEEVEVNARAIAEMTGRKPALFRSGTAYYDEVAAEIIGELGYGIMGFSVLGDRGATSSADEVEAALLNAQAGDVVIAHMNHPEMDTAEGIMAAVPRLRERGLRFVRLSEVPLK